MLDRISHTPSLSPEKSRISSDILSSREVRKSTQESLLSLEFDVAINQLSRELKSSYDAKHIDFDMASFEKRMREAILKVRDNQDIPLIAKKKFLADFVSKTEILSHITEQNILDLRKSRTEDSLGQEPRELEIKFGKGVQAESQIKGFYLWKILDKTIGEYIEPVAYSLQASFSDEKAKVGTYEFHKDNLEKFSDTLQDLDKAYGLNISSEIRTFTQKRLDGWLGDLAREDLYREMGQRMVLALHKQHPIADGRRVIELIQNGNLTTRAKNGRFTEVILADGARADIVDIVLAYKKGITAFQWTEQEIREASTVALSDGVMASTKRVLWMEQLKSQFDYLEPEDIEKKIKESSLSDLIIMMWQLAQLPPIFGDILSGAIEWRTMARGINSEGKLLSTTDRIVCSVFAVLGITVVGGTVSKLMKSKKFVALMKSLSLAKKYLPEKLSGFIKAWGTLNEQTKHMLSKMFPIIKPAYALAGSENRVMKEGQVWSKAQRTKSLAESSKVAQSIEYVMDGNNVVIKNIHGASESAVRRELSAILEKTHAETITFDQHIDIAQKRILANILAKNHPLIEVLRLLPGNNVVNVSFAGIKDLNGRLGAMLVDTILEKSKAKIMQWVEEFSHTTGSVDHVRLVRDDYKNLSVSVPSGIPLEKVLFGKITSKKQFIDGVINDIQDTINTHARKKWVTVTSIEDDIRKYFNFWVWEANVWKQAGDKDKLKAFAWAEGVAREGLESPDIVVHVFDKSRYDLYAKHFIQLEEDIIIRWDKAKFAIDGVKDFVIIQIGEQKFLNPELLRRVRKNGVLWSDIKPKELAEYIKRYIDALNKGFDFIVPARNLEEDLKKARQMSKDFSEGRIKKASLLETFKGVMTHEHFMHMVWNKEGMRLFIDIKDMGIENLESFRQLAKKIGTGVYSSNEILSAGKEMTDKFSLFVGKVKKFYPDALISLGWDEIRIFFPGVSKKESREILTSIEKNLQYSWLEGRSSHTIEEVKNTKDNENIFKKLDESTVLHKMIEAALLRKRALLKKNKKAPETISLELWSWVTEKNLVELLKNPKLEKIFNRIIDTTVDWNSVPKDIALPDGGMIHFQREWWLLRFLFTHAL